MAQIIDFPGASDREWRELAETFREQFKDMPDGPATIDECLTDIERAWRELNVPFKVELGFDIPGPLSEEQVSAIRQAVDHRRNGSTL